LIDLTIEGLALSNSNGENPFWMATSNLRSIGEIFHEGRFACQISVNETLAASGRGKNALLGAFD
jgi:hypothetical protein